MMRLICLAADWYPHSRILKVRILSASRQTCPQSGMRPAGDQPPSEGSRGPWSGRFGQVIPRLEAKPAQVAVVQNCEAVKSVMVDGHRVDRFLDRGLDADYLDPEIILTSTIPDELLERWFADQQRKAAIDIGAEAIIPSDQPVYREDPRSFRVETLHSYERELAESIPWFRSKGIEVIPLVKGETPYERSICYDLFDDHDISRVAYYCVQYFTYGYAFSDLRKRVQEISVEFEPEEIMLIGLQSENLLPELPPTVTAVAGQRWLRMAEMGEVPTAIAVQQYEQWVRKVHEALCTGQAPLGVFSDNRVLA